MCPDIRDLSRMMTEHDETQTRLVTDANDSTHCIFQLVLRCIDNPLRSRCRGFALGFGSIPFVYGGVTRGLGGFDLGLRFVLGLHQILGQ